MTTTFIIMATVLLFLVGLVWSKDDLLNIVIKAVYLCTSAVGVYIIFTQQLLGT